MATSESQQQAALARIIALAKREVADVMRTIDVSDAAAVAEVVVDVIPVIAERYGLAAGALAADWYEDLREAAEVQGAFSAVMADLPDRGRYESMAGWLTDKAEVEVLLAGGLHRIITDMHRGTTMRSAFADPQARGWARYANGDTCEFCFMLVTRGGVYTEQTAKFGAHDWCSCGAGPVWKGAQAARTVDSYKKSARRREDAEGNAAGSTATDQARAKDWIDQNL